ncbi:hypothetical protein RUMHYD_02195 [Blautia hydrogenotrophica DSM 10507]|uniref:Uncharacterized protein n=1 Tax=Blautia hydrogenotrophica (strain DSM 10507 / JCM 14656 / S5a33) TaxID=476272 RepID=C0CMV7_BLAHS|nr:hypothetical protein RUMHYD_02195 [Blautia hydrogenotrophica DSM 10507]
MDGILEKGHYINSVCSSSVISEGLRAVNERGQTSTACSKMNV